MIPLRHRLPAAWHRGLDTATHDLRHALRVIRKAPAFAASAVLTLAIGIGGNTAIFSIVRAVLIEPLAYHDPSRLVSIWLDYPTFNVKEGAFSQIRLDALRADARSFTGIAAYNRLPENRTLSGAGDPEALKAARVSANFLDVLGLPPLAGRGFIASEDEPGGPPVAMISAALWRRRFNADPTLPGRTVTLDTIPYTIIGILPDDFAFPFRGVDVWLPRPAETTFVIGAGRSLTLLIGVARLKPDVSLEQAHAELDVLNVQYLSANPERQDGQAGISPRIARLQDRLVSSVRPMLWILSAAVALVLLIACANVASLLLARAASRSREFAVRAAIGATRGRLIRQLLAESLVLAAAGGALGVLLAVWVLNAIANMTAFELPSGEAIQVDGFVLAFTILLSVATGVLFGAAPSLQASNPDLSDVLRDRGASSGTWASRGGWTMLRIHPRSLLVICQIALSIVLLIGAALLMNSVVRLYRVDTGFQAAGVLTMKVALPASRYDTGRKRAAFYDELARSAAMVPGVRGAAVARSLPTTPAVFTNIVIDGKPEAATDPRPAPQLQSVTPGYFQTMRIPLRRGRTFAERDNVAELPPVIVINESFARRYWPEYPRGVDPVGQRMGEGADRVNSAEIIGIVGNVREKGPAVEAAPVFYVLPAVHAAPSAYLAVRVDDGGDPLRLANALRAAVRGIDRDQAVSDVKTMEDLLESTLGQRRLTLVLLGAFASVALALAAIGLYGLMAYAVAQRTQEVGIRRALGATPRDILSLVLTQALSLATVGIACGLAGAYALTHLMTALLFDVSATDLTTFVGAALIFFIVAAAASIIPAWRAVRVDPMTALRV